MGLLAMMAAIGLKTSIVSIVKLNGEKVNGESLSIDHLINGDKIKYRYQKKCC